MTNRPLSHPHSFLAIIGAVPTVSDSFLNARLDKNKPLDAWIFNDELNHIAKEVGSRKKAFWFVKVS
ncbi:MAG: hypothetical protein JST76_08855 [Bacteroidetes bacterium]|nr:hypothetical protein [Bacteroidota bacterium]